MDVAEFVKKFEKWNFRYVVISWAHETRRSFSIEKEYAARENIAAKSLYTTQGTGSRLAPFLEPALDVLEPVFRGPWTAAYDGPAVLDAIRRQQKPQK